MNKVGKIKMGGMGLANKCDIQMCIRDIIVC